MGVTDAEDPEPSASGSRSAPRSLSSWILLSAAPEPDPGEELTWEVEEEIGELLEVAGEVCALPAAEAARLLPDDAAGETLGFPSCTDTRLPLEGVLLRAR